MNISSSLFQSTRPRGARPYKFGLYVRQLTSFNPRARVGRDKILHGKMEYIALFQSTRPRGARLKFGRHILSRENVSIHAPAWGATQLTVIIQHIHQCFNPRARVGRD